MIHITPEPGEDGLPQPSGRQALHVFHLPIEPSRTTASSSYRIVKKKDGGMFIARYQKGANKRFQESIRTLLHAEVLERRDAGDYPVYDKDTALKVILSFHFPAISGPKALRKHGCLKITKPDLDNMAKVVLDACVEAGLFPDDNQVACLELWKLHVAEGEQPHMKVCVGKMSRLPASAEDE